MLLALLLACEAGLLDGVVVTPNARIPTTIDVVWSLFSPAGTTFVEYGADADALNLSTPATTGPSATVIGLVGGRTWSLRAVTIDADGERWESEIVEVDVAAPPSSLPTFTISDADESAIDPNTVIFTTLLEADDGWIVGLNRHGEYVWWLESAGGLDIPSIHVDAAGTGLVFPQQGKTGDQSENGVIDASFSGALYTLTVAPDGHHDAIQLPDGRIAWIGSEVHEDVELESGETATLSTDLVAETDFGATSTDSADTRFSLYADDPHTPWRMCEHFDALGPGGGSDYSHANSLMYDEDDDAFLLMSKNLDALYSIDRQSGAIRWQAGGRYSDFTDEGGDPVVSDASEIDGPNQTWWSHGHMSDAWDDGFLVFDNGYHHDPPRTRAVEYAIDLKTKTLRKVWEFAAEHKAFNPLLGDVRRLPNGNYLISWTLQGMLTEVTPAGEVVWRASADLGAATGRVLALDNLRGG